jgi:hypothetical protein
MSSSTTLIGVDFRRLQEAVGSKDEVLKRQAIDQSGDAGDQTFWPIKLVFRKEGGVLLNDVSVTPDELRKELQKAENHGVKLYCIELRTGPPQHKFALAGDYLNVITDQMQAETVAGWKWEVPDEAGDSDLLPLEQAITELIDGKLTVKDEDWTYQYGYALECIARAIGEHLATIEGDTLLTHLKLKTPLSRRRKPVKLPRSDDVPEIGYMTPEEVQGEYVRLQGIDLAFSAQEEIETSRREYAAAVSKAAAAGHAIVAFGY